MITCIGIEFKGITYKHITVGNVQRETINEDNVPCYNIKNDANCFFRYPKILFTP